MEPTQWIIEKLKNNDYKEVYKLHKQFREETGSVLSLSSFKRKVRDCRANMEAEQKLLSDELQKLSKSKQGLQDKNNIQRKIVRESNRQTNVIEEQQKHIVKLFESYGGKLNRFKKPINKSCKQTDYTAVYCIADLHAGCIIPEESKMKNEYNMTIMTNRLKYCTDKFLNSIEDKNINEIWVFGLGDFVSSFRRLAEKLYYAGSTSSVTLAVTEMLVQMYIQILDHGYNIKTVFVSGNESRIYEDKDGAGVVPMLVQENRDYEIFFQLQKIFSQTEYEIEFIIKDFSGDVVEIRNKNILYLHGDTINLRSIEKEIQNLENKYMYEKDIKIDFTVLGNFHHYNVRSNFMICPAVMGGDEYAVKKLKLSRTYSGCAMLLIDDLYIYPKVFYCDHIKYNYTGYDIVEDLKVHFIRGDKNARANTRVVIENLV